jgi:integrase
MASIRPHKLGFRAEVCINSHRESRVFRTKREATTWAAIREGELLDDSNKRLCDLFTLRQLLEQYRDEVSPTKRGERWEFVRINAMLKGSLPIAKTLSHCTTEALGKWRDARMQQVSAGAVLRDIGLLSAIFEYARRELKWVDVNPIKDLRKPRQPDHRDIIISKAQIKALLKTLGYKPHQPIRTVQQSAAACFLLALRTGMRAGELTGLEWNRVFDNYCRLPVTKTTPRDVPLSKKALRIIARMRGFDDDLVFGLKSQTLDALFRRARDRAGLSGFVFHDSRHTAATNIAKKVDVLTLCKIFGWSDPKMAMIYYNPKAADLARMLD